MPSDEIGAWVVASATARRANGAGPSTESVGMADIQYIRATGCAWRVGYGRHGLNESAQQVWCAIGAVA